MRSFKIVFESDGGTGYTVDFQTDLTNSISTTATPLQIIENGLFQDLNGSYTRFPDGLVVSNGLNVGAAFTLQAASDVPLPPTALLLGTGLLGLVGLRRFGKN